MDILEKLDIKDKKKSSNEELSSTNSTRKNTNKWVEQGFDFSL